MRRYLWTLPITITIVRQTNDGEETHAQHVCCEQVCSIAAMVAAAAPGRMARRDANDQTRVALVTGGCVGCHGGDGSGGHGIPKIAQTMTRAEFVAAMKAFRDNQNNPTVMNRIARGYTDEEFALMAIRWAKPQ
ncbi:MAG: hypothetical protein RML45_02840 [Acetobacteraceae bacterium]|nr:hypothetical protein [Acetobacteraceae bacterium]